MLDFLKYVGLLVAVFVVSAASLHEFLGPTRSNVVIRPQEKGAALVLRNSEHQSSVAYAVQMQKAVLPPLASQPNSDSSEPHAPPGTRVEPVISALVSLTAGTAEPVHDAVPSPASAKQYLKHAGVPNVGVATPRKQHHVRAGERARGVEYRNGRDIDFSGFGSRPMVGLFDWGPGGPR